MISIRFIFVSFMVLLMSTTQALAYTVELSEDELQEKIEAKMPLEKTKYLINVVLTEPDVELVEGSDRIGFKCKIMAKLPGGIEATGDAYIDGNISYNSDKGEFHLVDPELKDLNINGVSEKYKEKIRKIVEKVVKKSLAQFPVYRFKDNRLKHKLAKALLDSVVVKNQRLILELSLF